MIAILSFGTSVVVAEQAAKSAGPAATDAKRSPFVGWQGMRVARQEGMPTIARVADLDGDGRDELIIVNTRQSRLDVYRWQTAAQREASAKLAASNADPDRPNELPMAPELSHDEVALNELPRDLLLHDVDGDGKLEAIILTSPPMAVVVHAWKKDKDGAFAWSQSGKWDLLDGDLAGRMSAMMLAPGDAVDAEGKSKGKSGAITVLVGFQEGIQTITLKPGSRARWLSPRDKTARVDWWKLDVDGDGDEDVLEFTRQAKKTVRWFENAAHGLLPPRTLFDKSIDDVMALPGGKTKDGKKAAANIFLLGGTQKGMLRRFVVAKDESNPLGKQRPLPLPGDTGAVWTGVKLGGKPALVAASPASPSVVVYKLGDAGWEPGQSFPAVSKVKAIAAPYGLPGSVLLWSNEASDLHMSYWEKGRLSYPRPMLQSEDVEDRMILALGSSEQIVWWAQKVGEDVDLYIWGPMDKEPRRLARFEGVGKKADQVAWLGGTRMLLLEKYARSPKLVSLVDGRTTVAEPGHVKKTTLNQYALLGAKLRLARLTDGVVQWLDEDLHANDQIMLPEGGKIDDIVPISDKNAWALERGGERLHLLKADDAGVMRVDRTVKIKDGRGIRFDPILGLILQHDNAIATLEPGSPLQLEVRQSIDSREGRPSGVKEATIHRLLSTDVDGDGVADLLLCDDRRHQLTVLTRKDGGDYEAMISWPVFEDKAYPYGGGGFGGDRLPGEPRVVLAADIDGDSHRDLILVTHDRLLFYLGRDATAVGKKQQPTKN